MAEQKLYFGFPQASEEAVAAAEQAWRNAICCGLPERFAISGIVQGLSKDELESYEDYRQSNGDRLFFLLLLSDAEGEGGP